MNRLLLSAFIFLLVLKLDAQVSATDSNLRLPLVQVNLGFHSPSADMAERFGNNASIGVGFLYKTRTNILLGADYSFHFGDRIHNSDSILKSISTTSGFVIDGNGLLAEVHMFERGFHTSLRLGYVIPILGPNADSGPFILLSGGLLQHRIRIENPMNVAPQVVGDYAKGYDKLTNGFALSQMVGYMFIGNKRAANFYAGFEFIQAWTESRRDWDFQLMGKDEQKRFDVLNGFKVGWILPIYKKATDRYYYF